MLISLSAKGLPKTIGENSAKTLFKKLKSKYDHGYLGARWVGQTILKDNKSRNTECCAESSHWMRRLRWILSAIALHGLKSEDSEYLKQISFRSNPLAYLLLIVDNLQERARPFSETDNFPQFIMSNYFAGSDNGFLFCLSMIRGVIRLKKARKNILVKNKN